MQAGIRELASGVDALYLSGRGALSLELSRILEEARDAASVEHVSVMLGGARFDVAAHGMGRYRFCLTHEYGQIGVSPSTRLPTFRIQPRTEFLHGAGLLEACRWFIEVLEAEVGPIAVTVSRVDLYVDFQGWRPSGRDRQNFVCRARELVVYEEDGELTGFTFGRRKTGTINARIYDKTRDAVRKGADFWQAVWDESFNPTDPVFRVEFEFARTALREYGLTTLDDVLPAIPALWVSATTEWLSLRSPTADETRSRWPIAPVWQGVQRATVATGAYGIERMYEGRRSGSVRTLLPTLNGLTAHFAALVGTDTIEETCRRLTWHLAANEVRTERTFADRVAEFRRREKARGTT